MKNIIKKVLACMLSLVMVLTLVGVQTPVTVEAATEITLSCTTKRVAVGGKYTLSVQGVTDKKATYAWSSSNKKVATVSKKGVVSGVAEGSATIKCKVTLSDKSTQTLSCKVTVKEQKAALSVSINNAKLNKNNVHTIVVGESYDFNRTLYPAKSNDKTYWYILDEEYAEVDESGVVTAKKAGTTTLIAQVGIDRISAEEVTNTVIDSVCLHIVEYTGLKENKGELQYYTEGEKDYRYTGLAEYGGKWWYVNSGKVDKTYSGVAYKNDGMWYIKNGTIDFTANKTVEYLGRTFEVVNGRIESTVSFLEENDVVVDVEKTSIEPIFDVSDDIISYNVYNDNYRQEDSIRYYEFEIDEKGLYWVQMRHQRDDYKISYEWAILDRFLNWKSGVVSRTSDNWGDDVLTASNKNNATHNAYFLNSVGKYVLRDMSWNTTYYGMDGDSIGSLTGEIFFVKPYVDISNATVINDGFSADVFEFMMNDATENEFGTENKYAVVYYEYIPEKTGKYVFWFDNINISKDKEVYKNNPLFEVFIDAFFEEKTKTVYVNGEDAYLEIELEQGRTIPITLFVYNVENSEKWRNGDVEYSMHISYQHESNITGYTSVQNRIEFSGNKNTYTIVPCGNQTIQFTLSQMHSDASVNVYVYDSNENMIQQYTNLKNNSQFAIADTLRDAEYKIVVEGHRVTDYCMEIDYIMDPNNFELTAGYNNTDLQLKYSEALEYQEQKDYAQAIDLFEDLGEYKDSKTKLAECEAAYTMVLYEEFLDNQLKVQYKNNNYTMEGLIYNTMDFNRSYEGNAYYGYCDIGSDGDKELFVEINYPGWETLATYFIKYKDKHLEVFFSNVNDWIGKISDNYYENGISYSSSSTMAGASRRVGIIDSDGNYETIYSIIDDFYTGEITVDYVYKNETYNAYTEEQLASWVEQAVKDKGLDPNAQKIALIAWQSV